MEAQRDHVLGRRVNDEDDIFAAEEGLLAAANAEDAASGELEMSWEALGSRRRSTTCSTRARSSATPAR